MKKANTNAVKASAQQSDGSGMKGPYFDSTALEITRLNIWLLKNGIIYRDKDQERWRMIERYEQTISQHLANVGVRLVMDRDRGFGYLKNLSDDLEDVRLPPLYNRQKLSFTGSYLCLYLRMRLSDAEKLAQNEVLLNVEEIFSALSPGITRKHDSDERVRDRILSELRKLEKLNFVRLTRDETREDRIVACEVLPALSIMVRMQDFANYVDTLNEYRDKALESLSNNSSETAEVE